MKKIFTFIAAMACAASVNAQIVFVHPDAIDGKEYGDGDTMIINAEEDEFGDPACKAPVIKNNYSKSKNVKFTYTIKEMTSGTQFSDCYSGSCTFKNTPDTYNTSAKSVESNSTVSTVMEWSPLAGRKYVYGSCTVQFDIYAGASFESSVTVVYQYLDPAGIEGVTTDGAKTVAASYAADGQRISNNAKGFRIERMSDGSIRKVVK